MPCEDVWHMQMKPLYIRPNKYRNFEISKHGEPISTSLHVYFHTDWLRNSLPCQSSDLALNCISFHHFDPSQMEFATGFAASDYDQVSCRIVDISLASDPTSPGRALICINNRFQAKGSLTIRYLHPPLLWIRLSITLYEMRITEFLRLLKDRPPPMLAVMLQNSARINSEAENKN